MSDTDYPEFRISSIDAARRQLTTAIALWFEDGDMVSIHTLACAAHEVIDGLSKKTRKTHLMFDHPHCKEEHRKEFNTALKAPYNFFKHSKQNENKAIKFAPRLTGMFILYSLLGLQYMEKELTPEESSYLFWHIYHRPEFLSEEGRKLFIENIPPEDLEHIRFLPKREFFHAFVRTEKKARGA